MWLTDVHLIDPAGREGPGALAIAHGVIQEVRWGAGLPGEPLGGLMLAPGLVDLGVRVGEPGERHRESFRSAGAAAAAGGVTTIALRPDTDPPVDTPEALEFVMRRAADAAVNVVPMACLTKRREGREMTEMGFLADAGACAFTDADRVVADTKVLSRALTYAAGLDALVIGHPQEPHLSAGAAMTSGPYATLLGLPAVSPLAERMGLERDLALAEATGVRYHADQVSTEAGLEVLARATGRATGHVTAGANIHHLTLNLLDVGDYRTFFKITPPLRSEDDRRALVAALAEGRIDVVCSMHTPLDEESKRQPFEAAAAGAVGLETLLPAALQLWHAGDVTLPRLWQALSAAPARLIGSPAGRLEPGAPADLVLLDPHAPFVLDRATLRSKSKSTPFDLRRMQGRVRQSWVGGEVVA